MISADYEISIASASNASDRLAVGATAHVLMAIEVDIREDVDVIISQALANGGSRYRERTDHGWMYTDSFADPDGHQWEVLFIDPDKTPE